MLVGYFESFFYVFDFFKLLGKMVYVLVKLW